MRADPRIISILFVSSALLLGCNVDFEATPLSLDLSEAELEVDGKVDLDDLAPELEQETGPDQDPDLPPDELDEADEVADELADELPDAPDDDSADSNDEEDAPPPSCESLGCPQLCCTGPEGPFCVDSLNDPLNCGGCNLPCSSGRCTMGSCCEPTSCARQFIECGSTDDGCGNVLQCGGCAPPHQCGARQPGRCASPFKLPDTATQYCIDNNGAIPCPTQDTHLYWGQDGCYTLFATDLVQLSIHEVKDLNTGLSWQPFGFLNLSSYSEAEHLCSELSDGGYTDWRLPTVFELLTLTDLGKAEAPYIVPPFVASADRYWTQSPSGSNRMVVEFDQGRVSSGGDNAMVRCVRGSMPPPSWIEHEGWLEDRRFDLGWAQNSSGQLPWIAALSYCESLELGGASDWRVPTPTELASAFEYTNSGLVYHPFLQLSGTRMWTATPQVPINTRAIMFESNGQTKTEGLSNNRNTLCVRSLR